MHQTNKNSRRNRKTGRFKTGDCFVVAFGAKQSVIGQRVEKILQKEAMPSGCLDRGYGI
jgi:hypothetical protein